jgi:hypothetical protein
MIFMPGLAMICAFPWQLAMIPSGGCWPPLCRGLFLRLLPSLSPFRRILGGRARRAASSPTTIPEIFPAAYEPGLDYHAHVRAVEAATGLGIAELAGKFESLGNDCEFGIFQRWCHAEVLGLFRFSNPHCNVVLREIESNFATFGDGSTVELDQQQPRREWIIIDRVRDLREHTFIWEGEQPAEAIREMCHKRTALLRRMMVQNMSEGNKIFVIKSAKGHVDQNVAMAISSALRRRGPNWLLWVEPGQNIGQIEVLEDGLMRGTIDRLTDQDGTEPSFLAWLVIIVGAFLAVSKRQSGPTPPARKR